MFGYIIFTYKLFLSQKNKINSISNLNQIDRFCLSKPQLGTTS